MRFTRDFISHPVDEFAKQKFASAVVFFFNGIR